MRDASFVSAIGLPARFGQLRALAHDWISSEVANLQRARSIYAEEYPRKQTTVIVVVAMTDIVPDFNVCLKEKGGRQVARRTYDLDKINSFLQEAYSIVLLSSRITMHATDEFRTPVSQT